MVRLASHHACATAAAMEARLTTELAPCSLPNSLYSACVHAEPFRGRKEASGARVTPFHRTLTNCSPIVGKHNKLQLLHGVSPGALARLRAPPHTQGPATPSCSFSLHAHPHARTLMAPSSRLGEFSSSYRSSITCVQG